MVEFEVTGKIKEICNYQSGTSQSTGKTWQRVDMVIIESEGDKKDGSHWENLFKFEAIGDIVNIIHDVKKPGDNVKVKFTIRTDEWNGKLFTKLRPEAVEVIAEDKTPEQKNAEEKKEDQMYSDAAHNFNEQRSEEKEEDGLPF